MITVMTPVESALAAEREIRTAPYDGRDPVVDGRDGHPDALASVAAVLASRGVAWSGWAVRSDVHGLGPLRFRDDLVPPRDPEDPSPSTAVLTLEVEPYVVGAQLRSVVSSAVRELRTWLDGDGIYIADVVVVVSATAPKNKD